MTVRIRRENVALHDGCIAYCSDGRNKYIVLTKTRSRIGSMLGLADLERVAQSKRVVFDTLC